MNKSNFQGNFYNQNSILVSFIVPPYSRTISLLKNFLTIKPPLHFTLESFRNLQKLHGSFFMSIINYFTLIIIEFIVKIILDYK